MIRLCAPTDEAAYMLDEAIELMTKNNIHLAEIRDIDGINVLDMTNEQLDDFYARLKDADIDVWSISSPVGKRDLNVPISEFKNRMSRAINAAKHFHANNIRVFSFFDYEGKTEEVVGRLQLCVDMAKEEGMTVSLENEKGSFAQTCETTQYLLDEIDDIKFVYDSSNFIQVGVPAKQTIDALLDRAFFVHFKDGVHAHDDADICPVGLGEAHIDELLCKIDRDMVLSLEHHLLFATDDFPESAGNPRPYNSVKGSCEYVYKSISDAFNDACLHARKALEGAGYKETENGCFLK